MVVVRPLFLFSLAAIRPSKGHRVDLNALFFLFTEMDYYKKLTGDEWTSRHLTDSHAITKNADVGADQIFTL